MELDLLDFPGEEEKPEDEGDGGPAGNQLLSCALPAVLITISLETEID